MVDGGEEVRGGDRVTDFRNHTLYAHWRAKGNSSLVLIIAIPVCAVVVVAAVAVIIVCVLLRVRNKKNERNHDDYDRGREDIYYDDGRRDDDYDRGREEGLTKPLIPCALGDDEDEDEDEDVHGYCRTVAESADVNNGSVVAVSADSILAGLYPEGYTRPSMMEALLAVGISEESAGIVCEACESIAHAKEQECIAHDGFTEEDAAAVAMYTFDFGEDGNFEENPYRVINKSLVSQDRAKLEQAKGLLYLVMSAVRKLPRVCGKVLYRGVRSEVNLDRNHYYRGNVVTWTALSSTSPDAEATRAFLAKGLKSGKARGTLFIIEGAWGYDIQPYSAFPTEAEILLEPERQFCVSSVIQGEGLTFINLKMLATPLSVPEVFGGSSGEGEC